MAAIRPKLGQVIRYSYLWMDEYRRGREEGVKDRPCVIVISVKKLEDRLERVIVVPVTHSPPADPTHAIEIPHMTKLRLGLDDERSWIVITEANQFYWPGPDLRPIRSKGETRYSHGLLPMDFFQLVRVAFVDAMKIRPQPIVYRTE